MDLQVGCKTAVGEGSPAASMKDRYFVGVQLQSSAGPRAGRNNLEFEPRREVVAAVYAVANIEVTGNWVN